MAETKEILCPVRKLELLRTQGKEDPLIPPEEVEEFKEDPEMVAKAEKFFSDHIFSLFVCMLAGLSSLMYVSSVVQVLLITQKSNNPLRSFKRYLSTLNHVIEWYTSPANRRASLAKVSAMHAKASKFSEARIGVRFTQYAMVLTQWAFVGPAFIFPDRVGMHNVKDEELEALAYQMFLIGRSLGIADKYNLCGGSLQDIKVYCHDIHKQVMVPYLEKESHWSSFMSNHLLSGIHFINPFIYPTTFGAWVKRLFEVHNWRDQVTKMDTLFEYCLFYFQIVVMDYVLYVPIFQNFLLAIINPLMRLNIHLANKFKPKVISEQSLIYGEN